MMRGLLSPVPTWILFLVLPLGCQTKRDQQKESSGDPSPSQLGEFEGCGFQSFDQSGVTLVNQRINTPKVTNEAGGSIFTGEVTGKAHLDLTATLTQATVRSSIELEGSPQVVQDARTKLDSYEGTRTVQFLSGSARRSLSSRPEWQAFECALFPASNVSEATRKNQTSTQFNPALPYFVPASVSTPRFRKEVSRAVTFSGITATVASTNNSTLLSRTYQGSATITPIADPVFRANIEGSPVRITADYAYKTEYSFGPPGQTDDITAALGLVVSTSYYVRNGSFVAIVVSGDQEQFATIQYLEGY